MRIIIGIVAVLLVLSVIYYFLPANIKQAINPFSRRTQTAQATASPSPSNRVTIIPAPVTTTSPFPSLKVNATPVIAARSTSSATASPSQRVASASVSTTSPDAAASNGLPGTGIFNADAELLLIQTFTALLSLLVGYKLSKHS